MVQSCLIQTVCTPWQFFSMRITDSGQLLLSISTALNWPAQPRGTDLLRELPRTWLLCAYVTWDRDGGSAPPVFPVWSKGAAALPYRAALPSRLVGKTGLICHDLLRVVHALLPHLQGCMRGRSPQAAAGL